MGFPEFQIPKKTVVEKEEKIPVDAPREQKVLALAKLLHSRGITVSLADAKRLAEGMVDIERKMIKPKEEPKPEVKAEKIDMPKPRYTSRFPEDFEQFIAHVATLEKKVPKSAPEVVRVEATPEVVHTTRAVSSPVVEVVEESVLVKEPEQTIAEQVAAVQETQVEAPEETVLASQPESTESLMQDILAQEPVAESTTEAPVETPVEVVQPETVLEAAPVQEAPMEQPEPVQVSEPAEQTTSAEQPVIPSEPTASAQVPAPRQSVDLAKQHGIDIFEMFKKKG